MVEHRKGLNRALFWLYSGHGRVPMAFRWSMLVFDLVTIGVFLVHPLVSWHDGVEAAKSNATGVWRGHPRSMRRSAMAARVWMPIRTTSVAVRGGSVSTIGCHACSA